MPFPTLENKKIFLTGGTGFFGKSILDCLNRGMLPDTEFLILSRDPERFLSGYPEFRTLKQVRFLAGDVRNFHFPDEKFDFIFHAATPALTTLPPGEMNSIILEGTKHMLDFAGKCGAEKLLFTSSGAIYGPLPPGMPRVKEDFPCNPATEYGIAKLEAEKMCTLSGIFSLLPRCFAFAGPRLNLNIHFAFGNFIRDCLSGQDIVVKGDGTPFRSYLYADDLVEWLFTILDRGENARPYNVGSPHGISIADLAHEVAECFTPAPEVRILGTPEQNGAAIHYVPDTARAEKELGLHVKVSLKDSIRKIVKNLSANPCPPLRNFIQEGPAV